MAKRTTSKRSSVSGRTSDARRSKRTTRPSNPGARPAGAGSVNLSRRTRNASSPSVKTTQSRPQDGRACRAKVRMYRQGLGDCFLISLPRSNGEDYKIMIDCGVILGTPDPSTIMTKVVDNIVQATGGKVDMLLATHGHWDHLSGFIQAADAFKRLSVGEVWLAWTEDPQDDLAAKLGREHAQALQALQMAENALQMAGDGSGQTEAPSRADIVISMLSFFGAASGGTTADAFEKVKAMGTRPVRYCRPSDQPLHLTDPDVRLYVLGPPRDEKLIRRTLPSKVSPETYGLALDGGGVLPVDVHKALVSLDDDPPFAATSAIPVSVARNLEFFHHRYWGIDEDGPDWRRIDSEWLDDASELALALDGATNNTSLVLAIELGGSDVLLFVADAQVGNWESWQSLSWDVDGRRVTGPDLLRRTIFYKVGHHGSHNATLRQNGLEQMTNLAFAAIPVDHAMAVKKRWGKMPLEELEAALKLKTGGRVLRNDQNPDPAIPGVTVDPLYFEISL